MGQEVQTMIVDRDKLNKAIEDSSYSATSLSLELGKGRGYLNQKLRDKNTNGKPYTDNQREIDATTFKLLCITLSKSKEDLLWVDDEKPRNTAKYEVSGVSERVLESNQMIIAQLEALNKHFDEFICEQQRCWGKLNSINTQLARVIIKLENAQSEVGDKPELNQEAVQIIVRMCGTKGWCWESDAFDEGDRNLISRGDMNFALSSLGGGKYLRDFENSRRRYWTLRKLKKQEIADENNK